MSEGLIPCQACARHVAARDAVCPFCGAARPQGATGPIVRSLRVSRAALFAAGAGTLLAAADCSQTTTPLDRDAEPPDAAFSDGPPNTLDATADAGPSDATFDVPTVQPAYGAVFLPDASKD